MKGRELRLRFEDGSTLGVPTHNGFYLYRVPEERLIHTQPRAFVLREHGEAIARFQLGYYDDFPLAAGAGATRRRGGADISRARRVLAAPTLAGPVSLFVAPSRLAAATCWWLWIGHGTYGGGCTGNARDTSSMWSVAQLRTRVHGRELWILWGRAGPRYASLELRYQDARRVHLARRHGFFLHVVRGDDRARGHRPALLVGRAANGRALRRELLLAFAWARQP